MGDPGSRQLTPHPSPPALGIDQFGSFDAVDVLVVLPRTRSTLADASWSPALLPRLIAASKADYYISPSSITYIVLF